MSDSKTSNKAKDKPNILDELFKLLKKNKLQIKEPSDVPGGDHLPYGTFHGIQTDVEYNFYDANINLVPFGITTTELEILKNSLVNSCETKSFGVKLEDVARSILEQETLIDLDRYDLHVSTTGARGAMIGVREAPTSAAVTLCVATACGC